MESAQEMACIRDALNEDRDYEVKQSKGEEEEGETSERQAERGCLEDVSESLSHEEVWSFSKAHVNTIYASDKEEVYGVSATAHNGKEAASNFDVNDSHPYDTDSIGVDEQRSGGSMSHMTWKPTSLDGAISGEYRQLPQETPGDATYPNKELTSTTSSPCGTLGYEMEPLVERASVLRQDVDKPINEEARTGESEGSDWDRAEFQEFVNATADENAEKYPNTLNEEEDDIFSSFLKAPPNTENSNLSSELYQRQTFMEGMHLLNENYLKKLLDRTRKEWQLPPEFGTPKNVEGLKAEVKELSRQYRLDEEAGKLPNRIEEATGLQHGSEWRLKDALDMIGSTLRDEVRRLVKSQCVMTETMNFVSSTHCTKRNEEPNVANDVSWKDEKGKVVNPYGSSMKLPESFKGVTKSRNMLRFGELIPAQRTVETSPSTKSARSVTLSSTRTVKGESNDRAATSEPENNQKKAKDGETDEAVPNEFTDAIFEINDEEMIFDWQAFDNGASAKYPSVLADFDFTEAFTENQCVPNS